MAASLHKFSLPPNRRDDDSLTWDQSIADIPSIDPYEDLVTVSNRSSLTFHAVAHGKSVVGTLPFLSENIIKWQTYFDHEVVALASNNDGSVTASATKSHISLIKGCDGSILATRQIASDKCPTSPGVVFVSRPSHLDTHDALVVFRPTEDKSDVILISNIDGPTLNSQDLNLVKDAAGEMKIDALSLPMGRVSSISGVFVNEETIRFFVAECSKVGVYDYNVTEMRSEVVVDDLLELMPEKRKYSGVEFDIDDKSGIGSYLVVAASSEKRQNIVCWFNVLDLSPSAQHTSESKITSIKAVQSCNPDKCVAAVYETKDPVPRMHIVQSLIVEPSKSSESMVLFTVDADSKTKYVEFASPPISQTKDSYSFRYLSKFIEDQDVAFGEFVCGDQAHAGMAHYLLVNNSFDQAYACISELDELETNSVISSPIHRSLVALWQFRHVLSKGNISSKENIIEAKECLRRLASSAIGGSKNGIEGLVSASSFLMGWPKNQALNDTCYQTITVQEVCMALSAVSTTITKVIEVLSASKVSELQEMKRKVEERQIALRSLREISDVDRLEIGLDDPYLAIGSLSDLLNCLVSQGAFKSVERLMKSSQWCKQIPTAAMASSVLRVPANIDPRCFLPWLCDLILPTLSIGDPMLETIRAWSCGVADKYDEDNELHGLDNAIMLLKAVSKATASLTVAMNTTFAHRKKIEVEGDVVVPDALKHNGSLFSSFNSNGSSARSCYSRPTVLNIGMISGMKAKGSKVFSAKRVELPSAASSDASLFPTSDVSIDEELEYDCVEDKLNDALNLKEARSLGMERECLTLKNFSSKGSRYIAKELVKVALKLADMPADNTGKNTVDNIRQFATHIKADFDEAVHNYAIELCDSSRDNIPRILHQAETLSRWCSSPQTRSLIVLKMLRKALVSIQSPPDLTDLAAEVLRCVTDGDVKSELEEALRLLTVDSLVRKYCGNGAQECFRVTEPLHCRRLVEYIADRHVETDGVLKDLLVLCDAFNATVSKVDSCVLLIYRVMCAQPRQTDRQETSLTDRILTIFEELYMRDREIAERVGDMMIQLCSNIIEDCRDANLHGHSRKNQQAVTACSATCSILSVMSKNAQGNRRNGSIIEMLKDFQRLSMLQTGCGIFLSHVELKNPASCVSVVVNLLNPCVHLLQQKSFEDGALIENLKPIIASAKHWCAILANSPSDVAELWSRSVGKVASFVAKTTRNHASLLLLQACGVLDEKTHCSSFHSVISVALTLFGRASSEANKLSDSMAIISKDGENLSASLRAMKSLAQASSLLREHIILFSPPSMLPPAISLVNLSEFLCDVSCKSDFGIGEKLDRYISLLQAGGRKHKHSNKFTKLPIDMRNIPASPVFHSSWYVGDGLLLSPVDTLLLCLATCENMLRYETTNALDLGSVNTSMSPSDMTHVLESRGAYYTSLRLVSFSDSVAISRNKACPFSDRMTPLSAALAQRSLGGIESGLTSSTIDHILSVSFLIGNLPKEKALNIYQSSLPSAIGQRDFSRVLTLANIGIYCGKGEFSSGEPLPWNKKVKFMEQCHQFAIHSKMWGVLSKFHVSFDPSIFTQSQESRTSALQGYCEQLIWSAARELDAKSTLKLASRFAKHYNVNKHTPASTLIKFLLSAPSDNTNDMRLDLVHVEDAVRQVGLPVLPVVNQSKVLRQCVLSLEQSDNGSDYDRHFMVLTMYDECLTKLSPFLTSDSRKKVHTIETENVQRRLNTLILLSSIFEKYPTEKRPNYTKLFQPLPNDPSQPNYSKHPKHGFIVDSHTQGSFDPLSALDSVLADDAANAMSASCSPLCSLLGLPSGYIHARSLVVKFIKMKRLGETLPSPESSVYIASKKLVTAGDRAALAWWCSSKYDSGSREQLKCLELAHMNASIASEQIEAGDSEVHIEEANYAIDRVKQIDLAKAILSDHILVHDVITHYPSTPDMVQSLYRNIVKFVQEKVPADQYLPEQLVKELLLEGSLAAAQASLDNYNPFSTSHFRSLAMLIHEACKMLSDRYSHINIGRTCRAISRRWLVYGDEINTYASSDVPEVIEDNMQSTNDNPDDLKTINEDNEATAEFIMDIAKMNVSSGNHACASQIPSNNNASGIKASDEPSVFDSLSQREVSEKNVSKVALRISFLMCFSQEYHRNSNVTSEDHDENVNSNAQSISKDTKARSRTRNSARQKAQCFEGDLALAHAKELMGIVFAKQGNAASAFTFEDNNDRSFSIIDEGKTYKNKALSFAMRHRALRVASILCPYDILVRVILEDGYASNVDDDVVAKIAFGSFVAMEIEAAAIVQPGLSLPHSDIFELSSMNFPSYARSLWRSQGGISSKLGGRLYLLLLELSMNHNENADWDMFILVFSELSKKELPRSLLFACEVAVHSNAIERAALMQRNDVAVCISDAGKKVFECISSAIKSCEKSEHVNMPECRATVDRLLHIISYLNESDAIYFAEEFAALAGRCKNQERMEICEVMSTTAVRIASHLSEPRSFSRISTAIKATCDLNATHPQEFGPTFSVCAESIQCYEKSFV